MPKINKTIFYQKKASRYWDDTYQCYFKRFNIEKSEVKNINYSGLWRAKHKAINQLKSYGYTVLQCIDANDLFDLLAFNNAQFVLVYIKLCEYGKLPTFKKVKEIIRSLDAPLNCKKELWVYEARAGWHHYSL